MIVCHSFAGTRSSRAALRGVSFSLLPALLSTALAFWSWAFCRVRRALFLRALADDKGGSGEVERALFLGVTGAAVSAACLYLSSSALERASFQSCLWLLSTSKKAAGLSSLDAPSCG